MRKGGQRSRGCVRAAVHAAPVTAPTSIETHRPTLQQVIWFQEGASLCHHMCAPEARSPQSLESRQRDRAERYRVARSLYLAASTRPR